jgi:hypothetical protein
MSAKVRNSTVKVAKSKKKLTTAERRKIVQEKNPSISPKSFCS